MPTRKFSLSPFLSTFSLKEWCVLNQVPHGGATQLFFNFPIKMEASLSTLEAKQAEKAQNEQKYFIISALPSKQSLNQVKMHFISFPDRRRQQGGKIFGCSRCNKLIKRI